MPVSPRSYLLTDLSWVEVRAHLMHDSRLVVPVGACDQYGPHLPIGTGTLIAEALADELCRSFGVLRAPALDYGVNLPGERRYAGTASLSEKTLHRMLNDLLASWEDHGFAEFILLTAHGYDPHVEAIATVTRTQARVRVIEALALDLSGLLDGEGGPEHGGEVYTSLMLYLHPDRVEMEAATDVRPESPRGDRRALTPLSDVSPGSVGYPTLASAEKGRCIFEYIVQKIREKVFLAPVDADD
jgi:creatinine amidohydrolase